MPESVWGIILVVMLVLALVVVTKANSAADKNIRGIRLRRRQKYRFTCLWVIVQGGLFYVLGQIHSTAFIVALAVSIAILIDFISMLGLLMIVFDSGEVSRYP